MRIDEDRAEKILEEECERARDPSYPDRWKDRIERLCSLAESSSETYIAAFGTQALAKATNLRAYTLSKNIGDKEGGYSARNFCKKVLAASAPRLGIDLGVTGREPLNNQPFFSVTYMDEAFDRVRDDAREAYSFLVDTLRELNEVDDKEEAREILRAFLRLRLKDDREAPNVAPGELSLFQLSEIAEGFVNDQSEGGRRAQAMTSAFFDAAFGPDRVETDRINDPDRKFPGDVAFFSDGKDQLEPDLVVEVRDKPVVESDIYHFLQKAVGVGVHRAVVMAVATNQDVSLRSSVVGPTELKEFASARGAGLRVYFNWWALSDALVFWSDVDPYEFASRAYNRVLERSIELEVSEEGVSKWSEHGEPKTDNSDEQDDNQTDQSGGSDQLRFGV